jgi:Ricin-type beta-trefoil lectin domain-like
MFSRRDHRMSGQSARVAKHPARRRRLAVAGLAAAAAAVALGTAAPAFAATTPATPDNSAPGGQVWGIEAGDYSNADGWFVAPPSGQLDTQGVQVVTTDGNATHVVSSDYQKWVISASSGANSGYDTISNRENGMCLDVQDASTAEGAPVIQWPCSGNANQQWKVVWENNHGAQPDQYPVEFQNENSGLYLEFGYPYSDTESSPLQQGNGGQTFTLDREGYTLTTDPVKVDGGAFVNATANCVPDYHFVAADGTQLAAEREGDSYEPLASSAGDIPAGHTSYTEAVASVPAGDSQTANLTFYHSTTPYTQEGQLTLYCDPDSVTS